MSKKSTQASAAVMAMLASIGTLPIKEPADHSQRNSNRMKLSEEELSHLETLNSKDKKKYVKELREKYSSRIDTRK